MTYVGVVSDWLKATVTFYVSLNRLLLFIYIVTTLFEYTISYK